MEELQGPRRPLVGGPYAVVSAETSSCGSVCHGGPTTNLRGRTPVIPAVPVIFTLWWLVRTHDVIGGLGPEHGHHVAPPILALLAFLEVTAAEGRRAVVAVRAPLRRKKHHR